MLTLLIARHGNTFDPGDTILRVGKRTDLPLSKSGVEQAKNLGHFLQKKYPNIDRVIVSSLKRTQQTASLALPDISFEINSMFDEIDYGVDDGCPESSVVARVGADALKKWEDNAIPVPEWHINPEEIIQHWKNFACSCVAERENNSVLLVVTSNGIARFAPHILANFAEFKQNHPLKLKTGAITAFHYDNGKWQIDYWNHAPLAEL